MSVSCVVCVSDVPRISNLHIPKESPRFESHPHRQVFYNQSVTTLTQAPKMPAHPRGPPPSDPSGRTRTRKLTKYVFTSTVLARVAHHTATPDPNASTMASSTAVMVNSRAGDRLEVGPVLILPSYGRRALATECFVEEFLWRTTPSSRRV